MTALLQYIVAPVVVVIVGGAVLYRLQRLFHSLELVVDKLEAAEKTILHFFANGAADFYTRELKTRMDEKRYERGN